MWETWGDVAWEQEVKWADLDEPNYDDVPTGEAEEEFVRQLVELKLTNVFCLPSKFAPWRFGLRRQVCLARLRH